MPGLVGQVTAVLRAPELSVRIEDASFENAAFVGRLPALQASLMPPLALALAPNPRGSPRSC